jgi:hypothetical protein
MNIFRSFALILGLLVLHSNSGLTLPRAHQPFPHIPIKVLIVDGFSNHNWKQTTRLIREILLQTGRFQVDVSTTPSTPYGAGDQTADTAWADWHPDFAAYDVVIQNTNNIENPRFRWPRPVEIALET